MASLFKGPGPGPVLHARRPCITHGAGGVVGRVASQWTIKMLYCAAIPITFRSWISGNDRTTDYAHATCRDADHERIMPSQIRPARLGRGGERNQPAVTIENRHPPFHAYSPAN